MCTACFFHLHKADNRFTLLTHTHRVSQQVNRRPPSHASCLYTASSIVPVCTVSTWEGTNTLSTAAGWGWSKRDSCLWAFVLLSTFGFLSSFKWMENRWEGGKSADKCWTQRSSHANWVSQIFGCSHLKWWVKVVFEKMTMMDVAKSRTKATPDCVWTHFFKAATQLMSPQRKCFEDNRGRGTSRHHNTVLCPYSITRTWCYTWENVQCLYDDVIASWLWLL